jgi:PAS domain S-box-containing protein
MARSSAAQTAGPGRPAAGPPGEDDTDAAEKAERPGEDGAEAAGIAELRAQLREARETIEAIRSGGVDSLVIGPPGLEQVYTLASADRTYRLIVGAMSEGAATVSSHGVILDVNPRLSLMTGQPGTQLTGASVLSLVSGASRPELARLLEVGPGGSIRGEVELTGPDGTPVPVLLSVGGFDLDGMILRCLVLTDLTAQRVAEAKVRALNAGLETRVAQRTAELEQANSKLEAFSYSVSHDLRAPLRTLSGYSGVLLEDYGDHPAQLQLSRVSRAQMNLAPVDLSAEAAAIAAELQFRDPGRRVRFTIGDGVRVMADRGLIRTVVRNLMENAWKFPAKVDEASIEFASTLAEDGRVCCYVRENGAGFDPAYAARLFKPFERLHAASDFPGTGIGLASVAWIVERHGGRVWADGSVGGGATFSFTLAAAAGAP